MSHGYESINTLLAVHRASRLFLYICWIPGETTTSPRELIWKTTRWNVSETKKLLLFIPRRRLFLFFYFEANTTVGMRVAFLRFKVDCSKTHETTDPDFLSPRVYWRPIDPKVLLLFLNIYNCLLLMKKY